MKHHLITAGSLAALVLAAFPAATPVSAQAVRRDTVPRATQQRVVRASSVDSLVECSPVAAPVKKKPVVRRKTPVRKVATNVAPRPKPTTPVKPRRPVVRRVRRVAPKATPAGAHSTTVVMCRPVRPIPALAEGTPVEKSVIPVPQLASAPVTPPTPAAQEWGPPIFVSTAPGTPLALAGGGHSWLPFGIVPAIFLPFVHSGKTHDGTMTPVDSTKPPTDTTKTPGDTTKTPGTPPDTTPVTPPPVDTIPIIPPPGDTLPIIPPPVIPPTTTVPEPSTFVLLGSGLAGLAGIARRRRRK